MPKAFIQYLCRKSPTQINPLMPEESALMTTESAEEFPTENAITRLRTAYAKVHFAMQGLWERSKKLWAAMHSESGRGPDPDYTPWEDERKILVNIIREQVRHGGGGNYDESGGSVLKWILSVLSALAVSSIVGIFVFWGQFSSLRSEVTEWKNAQQRQIDLATQRIERLENKR